MFEDCDVIVMRHAGSDFGSVGCEHISAALKELTGLQKLDLSSAWFHGCGCCCA
jgi:hypothetical protein